MTVFDGASKFSSMFMFAQLDKSVTILLTILTVLVFGALTYLLIRSIKKERVHFAEDTQSNGKIDKQQLMSLIAKKVNSGLRAPFCLIKIELNDITPEATSFQAERNVMLYKSVTTRIRGVLGNLSKFCIDDDGGLLIYNSAPAVNMNVAAHCTMLCKELNRTFVFSDAYSLDLSFNVAAVKYPQTENTVDALMKNLDMAMAVSKRNGLNTSVVNSPEIETQNSDEYQYFRELKTAIEKKSFSLYYQPVVDIHNGEVIGFESLLRWNHSTLGVLSPANFLRILEQTGDINWVGFWAFERLLDDYTTLAIKYPSRAFTMYMNLSLRQLCNGRLIEELKRILRKHNVPTQNICFDVSEENYYSANADVKRNLEMLHKQGFVVAIDNFGLEASSLTRLEKIRVSAIKLDRTVFETVGDDSSIGKNLLAVLSQYSISNGIKLVSIGVENEQNVQFAKENGIEYGQGYYFARPQPFEQAIQLVSQNLLENHAQTISADTVVVAEEAAPDDNK